MVGLDALRGSLAKRKAAFKEMDIPQMRLHQIFIQDPNGITAELNFFLDDETA